MNFRELTGRKPQFRELSGEAKLTNEIGTTYVHMYSCTHTPNTKFLYKSFYFKPVTEASVYCKTLKLCEECVSCNKEFHAMTLAL
jgi:hypothetical protein